MSQSKTYKMRVGDDVRELAIELDENGDALSAQPTTAVLKIEHGGVTKTRNMTYSAERWRYRLTDADFTELGAGATRTEPVSLPAEVYATFSDNSNATFPTNGQLTLVIFGIL